VPFAPTAFAGAGGKYLVYELRIVNLSKEPSTIRRLEVLGASGAAPLAEYDGAQLDPILQHFGNPAVGDQMPTAVDNHHQLAAGETAIVFLTIAVEDGSRIGHTLSHRLYTPDASIVGANTSAQGSKLLELGAPLQAGPWRAKSGAAKNDSHHRRQFCVLGGRMTFSSRYAIDWLREESGASFRGAKDDIHSYLSYESRVIAVSDGRVVALRDGIPDNKPGHVGAEALNLTLETITGNWVVLDLGNGQFAHYAHLRPGSLRVKAGDRVRRGELIARVGNSGSSFEPHLHFEVTTSAEALRGEGVPYLIDAYADVGSGSGPQRRLHQLPIADSLVEFR
jgi:murein DD-endopeptidase MepM/ murein hydrolase activator NlpD